MPLSKDEERKLADIGRALARDDPDFAQLINPMDHRDRQMIATIVVCVIAALLLLTGGLLVSSVPAVGLIIGFYGVSTLVVGFVVFIWGSRTAI